MEIDEKQKHWETVYQTKQPNEVSWTQEIPTASLDFIHSLFLPKTASIIDVGGGDSRLVDHLLEEGFVNVSVLDISEKALERAKERLGAKADNVNWIVSDITEFQPEQTYDLWHDRAAFHFLTQEDQIDKYLEIAKKAVKQAGNLIIGTFSTEGPKKCSGLDIKQYSVETLTEQFSRYFSIIRCRNVDHTTPFGTVQNFTFCYFKRND